MHWFTIGWWKYLFEPKDRDVCWLTVFWCRSRGHDDVWYYNPTGYEPDMHCKTCNDDLG